MDVLQPVYVELEVRVTGGLFLIQLSGNGLVAFYLLYRRDWVRDPRTCVVLSDNCWL
jgi:hypothetical protein